MKNIRKNRLLGGILGLSILVGSIATEAAPLQLMAEGAMLIEANTGAVLYSKNGNKTFYPASITKVLSTLLFIEEMDLGQVITMSPEAYIDVPWDSSSIGLQEGDQYSAYQGLYGVMLGSDNYIAYELAKAQAGDIETFAEKMNERAWEIGARSSLFQNPHGYHDENHYTTPYDMALITAEAFKNPLFTEIAGTTSAYIELLNKPATFVFNNSSRLLKATTSYYNQDVVGSKTGYHTPAGQTLVAKAVYDGIEVVGVIMKAPASPHQYEDMNELLAYGKNYYTTYEMPKGNFIVRDKIRCDYAEEAFQYAVLEGWLDNSIVDYHRPITKAEFVDLLTTTLRVKGLSEQELNMPGMFLREDNFVKLCEKILQIGLSNACKRGTVANCGTVYYLQQEKGKWETCLREVAKEAFSQDEGNYLTYEKAIYLLYEWKNKWMNLLLQG